LARDYSLIGEVRVTANSDNIQQHLGKFEQINTPLLNCDFVKLDPIDKQVRKCKT
jgi:hypothetical protein